MGSFTTLIGKKPAARLGDLTAHGGSIILGCPTVLIGVTAPNDWIEHIQMERNQTPPTPPFARGEHTGRPLFPFPPLRKGGLGGSVLRLS